MHTKYVTIIKIKTKKQLFPTKMHSLNNNSSNNSSDSESDLIKLRVQYVADTDPFTCLSMFPIPTRPVQYSFLLVTPLVHQMNNLIRVLNAPHRVSDDTTCLINFLSMKDKIHYKTKNSN